jgi:hypothetical protein
LEQSERQKQAKLLRTVRKIHRTCAVFLFFFFFIISITGLSLGWKKHSNGLIMAKTYQGSSTDLSDWLSIDSLHKKACNFLIDSVNVKLSTEIDRIDIRKDKGVVKFIFKNHFTALQLDGVTGKILHVEIRRSDFLEKLHDGSIIDFCLGIKSDIFKLIYTTIMGLALFTFTITGVWLWYGPIRMRNSSRGK